MRIDARCRSSRVHGFIYQRSEKVYIVRIKTVLWVLMSCGMYSGQIALADSPELSANAVSSEHRTGCDDAHRLPAGGKSGIELPSAVDSKYSVRTPLSDVPSDDSFERFASPLFVAEAIATHDTTMLVDAALMWAAAERILMRHHESGLSSRKLLSKAVSLAVETRDSTGLDRLENATKEMPDQSLRAEILAARTLTGESRAPDSTMKVSLETTAAQTLVALKKWHDGIRMARLTGDVEALSQIRIEIGETDGELTHSQQTEFCNLVDDALMGTEKLDSEDPTLLALTAPSRATAGRVIYRGAAEYGFKRNSHAPTLQREAVVLAQEEIRGSIDQMSNIAAFSNFVRTDVTQNIDASGSYSKIIVSGRLRYDTSKESESSQSWIRNGNNWLVLVSNVRIKPGTWFSHSEKNWKGERSSKAGAVMEFDYEVYGPDLDTESQASFQYTIRNDTATDVTFQLPSGREYTLRPGESGKYKFTGKPSRAIASIPNSKSGTYFLTEGNWHIIRLNNNRVGFGKW